MKIFRRCAPPVALWLLLSPGIAAGQQADSARTSEELARDSTLKIIRRIPLVGSVADRPARLITDSTVNFHDYRYAGDLVAAVPGVFLHDLGGAGQLHGLTIDGLGPRAFTFTADGVPLNDPYTGTFDPYLAPTEHFERMEIITGPRALLYGITGAGAAVNFVSKSRKDIHPYSRIRYSEAPYGTGFFDGMVSQDIIRGLNVTAGIAHRTSDGQYANSTHDGWNARLKLRYNVSATLNLYASEVYNQTQTGLNGGVDLTRTIDSLRFERLQAVMVNTDAYEKVRRHDLQLGAAMRLLPDSNAVTALTLFHTTSLREYRDEENREGANGRFTAQDHRSQWYGLRASHRHVVASTLIDLGAAVESRGLIASDVAGQRLATFTSFSGQLSRSFPGNLTADAFGRLAFLEGDALAAAGGELVWEIIGGLSASGGLARSWLAPAMILTSPARDSLPVPVPADSVHSAARVGLSLRAAGMLELAAFYSRHVEYYRAVSGTPPPGRMTVDAADIWVSLRAGWLSVSAGARYAERNGGADTEGPRWSGTGELYFWDRIAGGHLDLKTGLRVKVFSPFDAITFNQQYQEWLPAAGPRIAGSAVLDFVVLAQIGDAHLHLIWENLLDRQYVTASFFPMTERRLRFGISWDLLD